MSKLARKKTLPPKAPVDKLSSLEILAVFQLGLLLALGVGVFIFLEDISQKLDLQTFELVIREANK